MARVTVLMDNVASAGLACEWGLAMAVETDAGDLWLWDAGASEKFLDNARALGLDPGRARGLALSHGHYDHTGGLEALFRRTAFRGPALAHPGVNRPRHHARHDGTIESVGIPAPLADLQPVNRIGNLASGLRLITDIPRLPGLPQSLTDLFLDPEAREQDSVPDDAFLLLDSAAGPVVILGCCHAGLENSLACLRERLGIGKIHALMGGLHLFDADEERLAGTLRAIQGFGVERLLPGHCTGEAAVARLQERLDCAVEPLCSGLIAQFPPTR